MGNLILALGIVFVFTIWPTKKAAEWIGAGKTSYGSVIFAIILMIVFGIIGSLLSLPLAFAGTAGLAGIVIIMFFLTGKAYSIALDTTFWKGISIAFVAAIIGTIMQLILLPLFGVSLQPEKYEGEVTVEVIGQAADAMCNCGSDAACADEAVKEWTMIMAAGKEKQFTGEEQKKIGKHYKKLMKCWSEARK